MDRVVERYRGTKGHFPEKGYDYQLGRGIIKEKGGVENIVIIFQSLETLPLSQVSLSYRV